MKNSIDKWKKSRYNTIKDKEQEKTKASKRKEAKNNSTIFLNITQLYLTIENE